ncbi:hypothetical protein E4U56_002033 [Claviceps arundinis]|uniref:Uncharacterized protein n=1 Tax=Claviceps arundinis TaxID=1623583 RepID=A0A9P7MRF9_9HYPO|nr:hypothetical protein E4U56_002033 [Claviceps arundinis]
MDLGPLPHIAQQNIITSHRIFLPPTSIFISPQVLLERKAVKVLDTYNMKFSSVLGTFALATLEAYRAYASPLEAMSPRARSLEGRAVALGTTGPDAYDSIGLTTSDGCGVTITRGTTAPSKGGCKSWPLNVTCKPGVKGTAVKYSAYAC